MSVIPENRILNVPISMRTIRYTRTTESVVNGANEITIDPGRDIEVDPITYSVFIKEGIELEIANPLDFVVTVQYEKSFLAINKSNNIHKIFPGSSLPPDWKVENYILEYDEITNIEKVIVFLHGSTPFKSRKRLELLKIEFLVFLPFNQSDVQKENSRDVTIHHKVESMLDCVDFTDARPVDVHLSETCAYEFRTIKISASDYYLGAISPIPVNTSGADIDFSIAFNDFTELRVINSNGEIVDIPISKILKAGLYTLKIPIEKLPNGVYFIEMRSGEFFATRKFNVIK
jgi:hypothetical protein